MTFPLSELAKHARIQFGGTEGAQIASLQQQVTALQAQVAALSVSAAPVAWVDMALAVNWAAIDASHLPQYMKQTDGNVYLRGGVERVTAAYTYPTTLTTLPVGFRPSQEMFFVGLRHETGAQEEAVQMQITTAGLVIAVNSTMSGSPLVLDADAGSVGNRFFFDNISFPVT